jgi:hypothetical protein
MYMSVWPFGNPQAGGNSATTLTEGADEADVLYW